MQPTTHRYFILHKPYNMVSQFKSSHDVVLLKDLVFKFPEGTHAIGRLDNHSEGLLLLTTNKTITKKLFQGEEPHKRTYLVMVRRKVSNETLQLLRTGVTFQVKGNVPYTAIPFAVELVDDPNQFIAVDNDAVVYEPFSWLLITLTEGKFHQVRKMVAAVGHKCKRLIRTSIEDIQLGDLKPRQVKEMEEDDFFRRLRLKT